MAGKSPSATNEALIAELEALHLMTKYIVDGLEQSGPASVVAMFKVSEAALREEIKRKRSQLRRRPQPHKPPAN